MIYLSVPSNMIFKKLVIEDQMTDCFVNKEDETHVINLQAIVKEALKENKYHPKMIERKEFTIYLKKPPFDSVEYLGYTPNRNGKLDTEINPVLIKGIEANGYRPQNRTRYGQFWNSYAYLSSARNQQVVESRIEQRDNRTKIGDSPNGN